jgi:hypothetical protein
MAVAVIVVSLARREQWRQGSRAAVSEEILSTAISHIETILSGHLRARSRLGAF